MLDDKVAQDGTVAIVRAGSIGLTTLLTAQCYSPAQIIMADLDDQRIHA
ncbi:hypothetical protein QU481_01150 [Crenobacter sp. SG2303]|uniref:Lactate/malate dehydrogenase N-terminal domain-containing protein n=1 Tax=Crenobacter oryzisoli TaxID=3056844 RepID=A0ABT7XIA4_9NEIS|nr:hypothetical protein [Crenobacter sp. SG2303]MDN0073506.1 hypothetical protein [Crenobacter sp. SG2303]